jgi:hypothetical protein
LLRRDIPTRDGFDRDEYPPALGAAVVRAWNADAIHAAVGH